MAVEQLVSERYADGAKQREDALCCPVDYDASLLKILPKEIIEKDYGCGDPSRYAQPGDTVLDLGSGGGKICYMAAQIVGTEGRVIGIDMTDDMLALARSYKAEMAEKLGNDRVDFRKGRIQDLALSMDAVGGYLAEHPVTGLESLQAFERFTHHCRVEQPMVANSSVDLVISNCVLNLVDEADRTQMLDEIFRVLKPGGRVAISDIVSDEYVPQHLKDDAHLWSGCISGAFHEKEFLQAFIDAGFVGVGYDKWDIEPWQVVENIEFRSVTLTAVKPIAQANQDIGQAVLYKGPFHQVTDDFGITYPRGERIAVGNRTFEQLASQPYADSFIFMQSPADATPVNACCQEGKVRAAATNKGSKHQSSEQGAGCC